MSFFENTRKPVGLGGKLMVAMMNLGHTPVATWGLEFLHLSPDAKVLDCVCPHGYRPAADVLMFAHKYGSAFHLTADPAEGIQDADVVATAVWNTAQPGTSESEQRLRDFVGFQLTGKLLESAKPDVMVLHCLPAHRGEEISSAVFEQHAPEIFDEAENRLHVQKAVLAILLAGK